MDDCRGVQRGIDNRNAPPPDVNIQPPVHRREGNVAERVIEEVREDVREHHKAAGEPHLPNANASQPNSKFRRGFRARRAHVNDCRRL